MLRPCAGPADERGAPSMGVSDNDSELTSDAIFAYRQELFRLHYVAPTNVSSTTPLLVRLRDERKPRYQAVPLRSSER